MRPLRQRQDRRGQPTLYGDRGLKPDSGRPSAAAASVTCGFARSRSTTCVKNSSLLRPASDSG